VEGIVSIDAIAPARKVNRLQNRKFPHCPAIQATGLGLLPRWDFHPLFMPAFAGRTHSGSNL
jgi:hypothetical protein